MMNKLNANNKIMSNKEKEKEAVLSIPHKGRSSELVALQSRPREIRKKYVSQLFSKTKMREKNRNFMNYKQGKMFYKLSAHFLSIFQ